MKKNYLIILCAILFVGCKAPQQISYFQDAAQVDQIPSSVVAHQLTILPGDVLSIMVHSHDAELAALFNLSIQGYRIGQGVSASGSNSQATASYTVDSKGNIDFPQLGSIHVAGMTRDQLAEHVKGRLVNENRCKDAVVTVEMSNAYVNVMGEVAKPGRYAFTKDRLTVLDAISMAGDLTIQGRRENVIVLRRDGDITRTYTLNLMSIQDVASSPAYFLQQDDVVYVEPNDYRKRQTTVNGNNALSTGFWISIASLLMTVLNIFL